MAVLKRVVIVIGGVFALWIITLAILGAILSGRYARNTEQRVGESLQATATVARSDLALIRGRLTLDNLAVRRIAPQVCAGSNRTFPDIRPPPSALRPHRSYPRRALTLARRPFTFTSILCHPGVSTPLGT